MKEEIFGPVLPIKGVKNEDEAIAIINRIDETPLALCALDRCVPISIDGLPARLAAPRLAANARPCCAQLPSAGSAYRMHNARPHEMC